MFLNIGDDDAIAELTCLAASDKFTSALLFIFEFVLSTNFLNMFTDIFLKLFSFQVTWPGPVATIVRSLLST